MRTNGLETSQDVFLPPARWKSAICVPATAARPCLYLNSAGSDVSSAVRLLSFVCTGLSLAIAVECRI